MFPFGGNQGQQTQQPYNPYQGCEIERTSYGSSNYHNSERIRPDNNGKALDAAKASSDWMGRILALLIIGGVIQGALVLLENVRSGGSRSQPMEQVR